MLKELGQIASLLRQAPKVKEEMERLQARLAHLSAEGDAGGGLVRVRVNGRMEVQSCRISEDAFRMADRELLEELIRSATNQALDKVRQLMAEETGKVAASFGFSALPGLESWLGPNDKKQSAP
jgi:DNA-binding YbaB/EbfC family protein